MDDIQYQDPSMDNLLSPSQPLQINFQVGSQPCVSKFICSAYNPCAQCVLTQGISIPHPETQTVDWVMLVTPGFCQATSRCTVDLQMTGHNWWLMKSCSSPPFHNTRWPLSPLTSKPLPANEIDIWVFNKSVLEKERCSVNHWTSRTSKSDNKWKVFIKKWHWWFACVGNLLVVGTLQYSHSGGKERVSYWVVEEMRGNISCFFCFLIVSLWAAPGERRCQRRTPSSRSLPPLTATMSQDDVLCKKVFFKVDLLAKNRFCATIFRCKR